MGLIMDPELGEDAVLVVLDRLGADPEAYGDLTGGVARTDHAQHLALALSEWREGRVATGIGRFEPAQIGAGCAVAHGVEQALDPATRGDEDVDACPGDLGGVLTLHRGVDADNAQTAVTATQGGDEARRLTCGSIGLEH